MSRTPAKGIYAIIHPGSQAYYVGQSRDVQSRWSHHRNELRKDRHVNRRLQHIANKYGVDSLEHHLISELPLELLNEGEQLTLDLCKGDKDCVNALWEVGAVPVVEQTFPMRLRHLEQYLRHPLSEALAELWEANQHIKSGKSSGNTVYKVLKRLRIRTDKEADKIREAWATEQLKAYTAVATEHDLLTTTRLLLTPHISFVEPVTLYHDDGRVAVIDNMTTFAKSIGYDSSSLLNKVVRGEKPSAYGWRRKPTSSGKRPRRTQEKHPASIGSP
ncbi:MAG TPA: GIY-YIG nuclease family protein [Gemmatimonadales bacterium]|jgi:hypothetical protein